MEKIWTLKKGRSKPNSGEPLPRGGAREKRGGGRIMSRVSRRKGNEKEKGGSDTTSFTTGESTNCKDKRIRAGKSK